MVFYISSLADKHLVFIGPSPNVTSLEPRRLLPTPTGRPMRVKWRKATREWAQAEALGEFYPKLIKPGSESFFSTRKSPRIMKGPANYKYTAGRVNRKAVKK